MANGDAAAAAGMDVVASTDDRRNGYDEINKTRDYIADRTSAVTPITKGGTGATSASGARTNLGIPAIGVANIAEPNKLPVYNSSSQLTTAIPTASGHAASKQYVDNKTSFNSVSSDGDVYADGNLRTPNRVLAPGTRSYTVTTSYASVYVNGDGWFGLSPSAERFKQDIEPRAYSVEQIKLMQVVTYRLKNAVALDPGAAAEVGVIAEQLIDAGLPEFVIFDEDGNTQSVAYERLVLVVIGAVQELAERVENIEARLAALEAAA